MSECNSVELTYYQRNRDVILNRVKDYYKNDKESKQKINTETYLKKKNQKKRTWKKQVP